MPALDVLNHHAESLQSSIREHLNECEENHLARLSQLTADFETNLRLEEQQIEKLNQPIAEEKLRERVENLKRVRDPVSGKTVEKVVHEDYVYTLGHQMQEFQRLVESTEKDIGQLWQEWTEVQSEIVAMAIKLGRDDEDNQALSTAYSRDTPMYRHIEGAIGERLKGDDEDDTTNSRMEALIMDITKQSSDLRSSNRELQKVSGTPRLAPLFMLQLLTMVACGAQQYTIDMRGYLQQLTNLAARF